MKNLSIKLLLLSLVFFSCDKKKEHLARATIYLLVDNTDTNRLIPTSNSLLSLYDFKDNICRAVTFRESFISDFATTKEVEFSLDNRIEEEKSGNLYDDPTFRKKQIIRFQQDVSGAISEIQSYQFKQKPETKCFEKVCMELQALRDIDGNHKILVIISDLIENSDFMRGYSEGLYHVIQQDERKARGFLMKKFKDRDLLPNKLTGITVYILHQPQSIKEDVLFKTFSNVYRLLLEEQGATVFIKATNVLKDYCHE
jgi:hypothetical protein